MLSGNFHHSSRFYYFTHEPLEPEPEVEQTGKKNKDKLFTLLVDTGNMCVWRGGEEGGGGNSMREIGKEHHLILLKLFPRMLSPYSVVLFNS